MEPEPGLNEPWRPEEVPQTLLRRVYESDLFAWFLVALKILVGLAIVFAVVLVILHFTEGPGSEGRPIPL